MITVEFDPRLGVPPQQVEIYVDDIGRRSLCEALVRLRLTPVQVLSTEDRSLAAVPLVQGNQLASRLILLSAEDLPEAQRSRVVLPCSEGPQYDLIFTVEVADAPGPTLQTIEMHLNENGAEHLRLEMGRFKDAGDHTHFLAEGWGGDTLTAVPLGRNTKTADHLQITYVEGLSEADRRLWKTPGWLLLTDSEGRP